MIVYLDTSDLLLLATAVTDGDLMVRDGGLLDAAAYRPHAEMFGVPAYETLWLKSAALLDSIVRTRPLVEGNWRLAWVAAVAMCDLNGWWVEAGDDAALDLVREVGRDQRELPDVAALLESWAKPKA
ncbi:Fic family protein [Saccharopolyspora oryzae]|uniref:Death-on-curing protein n=1 Tax=Saccharopolyspora oryzae TaxID=2997343 RepID=A0ABT4UVP7_9PSEU|nr:Fic family protein [Saccharopolyspora oryzae]MDA3625792.1 death-on-curing protein [Saccharopolyspora oryzae]